MCYIGRGLWDSRPFLKIMIAEFKSEAHLQSHCYQWTREAFPDTRDLFYAIPNGGSRRMIEAMQLKAQGVVPGVADMEFKWKGKCYLFEFKYKNGKQSEAQKKWQEKVENHGFDYFVINDDEAFKRIFSKIVKA
jgi:hypothetical protein